MDLMDGWKKVHKAKSCDDSCSDGGGSDEITRPPRVTSIPTNINTKKREKLNGKVVNGHVAVVPRKLRSAIQKRSSHGHEGGGMSKKRRFKQRSTVAYTLTKDEEEVVETLSSLSCIVSDHRIVGRLLSNENGDTQATNSTIIINEDRNGQAAKLPMIIAIEEESLGASSCMDYLDTEAKRSTHESGNNVEVDPTGSIVHAQPPSNNGILQQHVQLKVPTEKSEFVSPIPPLPVSTLPRQEIKSSKEFGQIIACQQETHSNDLNIIANTTSSRGNITEYFSAKTGAVRDSRSGPTENRSSIKKPLPGSDCRRRSWRKCASHVYISHLIRNCQLVEKNSHWQFTNTQPNKLEERRELHVVAGIKSTDVENCRPELKIEMLQQHNRANLRPDSNHTATSSSIYSPAKPTFDFLSLTGGIKQETSSSQLPVLSYLHTMPPSRPHHHHNMIPFSLPPAHYSNYPEHLAAQQQLPHYVSLPFYGLHMNGHVGVGGVGQQQHQQQQIWHAHLTNYRPPPPVIPKWQNGASPSSSSFSGSQQIMAIPFPSSGNPKRQQQQTAHHNLPGSYNDSSQLQVLCSPQRM
ncbi:hypothetical protein ZOSMA_180G00190 [Zostera marina]|uniref:Uncharacterized protein n=1 Tax=Zostera marina TaxID=29655 RepID=A0A0K9PQT2_ZOSMR|nr:hypothetical protein ZOSMA_180G00190 [Zostera marina]